MNAYRPSRSVTAGLAVVLTSLALLAAPPSAAHAQGIELVCAAESTSNYAPGLTRSSQPVTITQSGKADPCVSPSQPGITAGTWELTATGTLSCVTGSASGQRVYSWNTGETSVEEVTLTVGARPEGQTVLVTEGRIVKGVFAGATTHSQAVLTSDQLLACSSEEGLTSTSGPRLIQFAQL